MLDCFNWRWAVETTCEETRAFRDGNTAPVIRSRNLPDNAVAARVLQRGHLYVYQNCERLALSPCWIAWCPKPVATFAAAIGCLDQHLRFKHIVIAAGSADMSHPIPPTMQSVVEAACYAQ